MPDELERHPLLQETYGTMGAKALAADLARPLEAAETVRARTVQWLAPP
jgi:hypothetical protein